MTLLQFPAFADKLIDCGHKTVVRVGLIHTMEYRNHVTLVETQSRISLQIPLEQTIEIQIVDPDCRLLHANTGTR